MKIVGHKSEQANLEILGIKNTGTPYAAEPYTRRIG